MADTTGVFRPPSIEGRSRDDVARRRDELSARGIHPAAGERMAKEQPVLHYLYEGLSNLSIGLDKDAIRSQIAKLRTATPEQLAGLRLPVLCVVGEEDILIAPDAVEAFAAHIPNARVVRVPEAGHSVYFERAEEFNRLLAGFLDTVDR